MRTKTFTHFLMAFSAFIFLTFTVNAQTTVSIAVTDSTDVEENLINGEMYWNSSDLELGRDGDEPQVVGLQFRNVPIPAGATITEAYIQFTCDEVNDAEDAITLEIVGDAADNSDTLKWGSANAYNVSSREKTTAVVEWSPPPWETVGAAADSQKTADISTVIAEIVGRDGWASGNALTIMIQAKDTANLFARWAESGYSPDDAAVLYITYEGDSPTKKVSYTVTDSTDVEENLINGEMYWNSSDLELGRDGDEPQVVGLQFRDVDIPNGATITDAYIQFTCDEINDAEDAITLEIVGDAADNSDTLKWGSANAYNVSSREKTTAVVEWSPPPWETVGAAADSQKTADISSIITEIVGRAGWASGNALTIMIQAKDTANLFARWAESGYSPDDAAVLHVTYEGDEEPGETLPVIWEPGFESDTVFTGIRPSGELIWRDWDNTSINEDAQYVYSGNRSMKSGPLSGGRNQYTSGWTAGTTLTLFAWATIDDVSPRTQHAYIGFREYITGHIENQEVDSRIDGETTINEPGVWVRLRACMTLSDDTEDVLIYFWNSADEDPGPSIYIDDLEFKFGDSCTVDTRVDPMDYNASSVNVYPNPTTGPVHISIGNDVVGASSLEIFDVTGKVVSRIDNLNGREEVSVDLSSAPAGIYIGLLRSERKAHSFKILKKQ